MRNAVLISFSVLLSACGGSKHPDLIAFSSTFHRDITQEEWESPVEFEPFHIVSTSGDTLLISVFDQQAGCKEFDGDFSFRNDTIVLDYWNAGDEACTHLVIYEMKYKVFVKDQEVRGISLK